MPPPRPAETQEYEEVRARQTARVFRQQIVGLAVAGLLVLGFSLWRAGRHTVFMPGWWRW